MRRQRRQKVMGTVVTLGVLLMSTATAWVVSYSLYTMISKYQDLYETTVALQRKPIEVVVAARTLDRGTTIAAEDLKMHTIGQDYVPHSAITAPELLMGLVVQERVLEGDLLRTERLAAADSGQGLSATIPVGMRAVALHLVDNERVSGFIEPGDHVDVVATLPSTLEREAETYTLLHAVEILAVDEHISPSVTGDVVNTSSVTLGVTPEQAETLTLLDAEAIPRLVLRSEIDFRVAQSVGARSDELLGRPEQRLTIAEYSESVDDSRRYYELELYHGTKRTVERIRIDDPVTRAVLAARPR